MIEREKRWMLKSEPPQDKIKETFIITQVYAHFNPDVRIRKISKETEEIYYHTVKYILKDNTREELEHRISKERYERIFEVIDKKPIIKKRILVNLGDNLIAEIDYFIDTGDTVIEVEFSNEEMMNNFIAPDWFGKELKKNESINKNIFTKINNTKPKLWD